MKRLSITIFLFLSFLSLQSQELTNAGREFWVTSSKNIYSDTTPDSALNYIMGDTLCTGWEILYAPVILKTQILLFTKLLQ